MAGPSPLEPTANNPEQRARWERNTAERVNYLLRELERVSARVRALESPGP